MKKERTPEQKAAYERIKLAELEKRLDTTGLPRLWRGKESIREIAAPDFIRPVFLTGPAGRGKTHLMAKMLYSIIKAHFNTQFTPGGGPTPAPRIKFVDSNDLAFRLRNSFRDGADETEYQIVKEYTTGLDWLFLDDMGAEKPSDYVLGIIDLIINKLYNDEIKLVASSNLSLKEISHVYGDRVASRILEMCEVAEVQGHNRRAK